MGSQKESIQFNYRAVLLWLPQAQLTARLPGSTGSAKNGGETKQPCGLYYHFSAFLRFREENVTSDDNSVWNEYIFNAVFSNCWFVLNFKVHSHVLQCGQDKAQDMSRSCSMQIAIFWPNPLKRKKRKMEKKIFSSISKLLLTAFLKIAQEKETKAKQWAKFCLPFTCTIFFKVRVDFFFKCLKSELATN